MAVSIPFRDTTRVGWRINKESAVQADLSAEIACVIVDLLAAGFEVQHVRDQRPADARPPGKLVAGDRVDDDVPDVGVHGRKGLTQIIHGGVAVETLPLPIEVVVVSDRGQIRFDEKLGDRQAKRNVDGNRQRVFYDQDVKLESSQEFLQSVLRSAPSIRESDG